MVVVEVPYRTRFVVKATPQQAFDLVSDVHRSGSHFPGVESLVAVNEQGLWRWVLAERGFGPIKLRACYEALYEIDPEAMRVVWRPAGNPGDMESHGSWAIEAVDGGGAALNFETRTLANIPAPRMMAGMVESFTKNELLRLKASYVEAIRETLDGV